MKISKVLFNKYQICEFLENNGFQGCYKGFGDNILEFRKDSIVTMFPNSQELHVILLLDDSNWDLKHTFDLASSGVPRTVFNAINSLLSTEVVNKDSSDKDDIQVTLKIGDIVTRENCSNDLSIVQQDMCRVDSFINGGFINKAGETWILDQIGDKFLINGMLVNRENIILPSTIVTFEKFKNEMVKIEYIDIHSAYGHHPFPLLARKAAHNEMNSLCHLKLRDVLNRIKNYVDDNYDDILVSMDFPANKEIGSDFVVAMQISNRVLKDFCIMEYDSDTGSITKESSGEEYEFIKGFRDTIKEFTGVEV